MCGLIVNEKRESATSVKALYVKVDEALDETIKRFWVTPPEQLKALKILYTLMETCTPSFSRRRLRQTERSLMGNPHKPPSRKGKYDNRLTEKRSIRQKKNFPPNESNGSSLQKELHGWKALADEEDLRTILCEIGARLNLRPLTHLSSERKDLEMLTLYHF
ncbi:hypothetical protein T08_11512 [Trichinella sp. T8]|nr:hypothetical protein T08_11512 [Trichinella sp. T8]